MKAWFLVKHLTRVEPMLLSIRDAATALGIGRTLVYELVSCGDLASVKIGRRRLIRRDAIEKFVKARTVKRSRGRVYLDGESFIASLDD